ncbi:NAD(P)-dependent oxidoreductase [Aquincola tertiaricarbonis]|uniref:NAD(P)-dependent oxidoreductase n=1 Tax=Aquincola tertiaricarbonis TaxID=391953 RepID=UPI000614BBC6|nr:NAD(P)-dependent oxidoreductase [Aquincola tertiaricarbonis]
MDVLILDAFDADVARWLAERHGVHHAPELMNDADGLRAALLQARALVAPQSLRVDGGLLGAAPQLRALARVGSEPPAVIDLDACERAGVEVVRNGGAQATANAEFVIGALLHQWRRGAAQRELGSATIGLFGMQPAARSLAALLQAFGARVVGYDPSLHASDPLWSRWQIEPLPLRDMMAACDGVCVLLPMFSRYRGLLGERVLSTCKPGQVLVSLTHSSVFDELALAEAMADGRVADVWLDDAEPGLVESGRPLHGLPGVQVTSRLADSTREARERSAWTVARRIDALLAPIGRQASPGSRPAPLYAAPSAA